MSIEIICTGDEVLTGKIVNSNFSYISQKLEDVGLTVRWGTTVGDDRDSLLAAFKLAGERAEAVIVNGGLGPPVPGPSPALPPPPTRLARARSQGWLAPMPPFSHPPPPLHSPTHH